MDQQPASGPIIHIPRRSFSALTVCEIRQGPCRKGEGATDRFRRLCAMYALEPVELRLLMQVDDEHIDAIGRIRD
jgi:hypothetical protein